MALVIDNPEMLGRIEQLSAALGKPALASVDAAVMEKLDRIEEPAVQTIDWGKVREIQDWVVAQPHRDRRSVDELFYDEHGLFD
jgi:hypothetical protein